MTASVLLVFLAIGIWYYPYEIDYGRTKNGVYRNAYFQLSLPVQGWYPVDLELAKWREQLIRDPEKAKSHDHQRPRASSLANLHLVSVYDRERILPGEANANLFLFAEKRSSRNRDRNAEDYLKGVLGEMVATHPEARVTEPIVMAKVGRQWLPRMRVEITDGKSPVFRQEYYAVYRRGYFLSVVLSWEKPEDRYRLQGLLEGLRFR